MQPLSKYREKIFLQTTPGFLSLKMDAARFSEMLVRFLPTIHRHIPEDDNLHRQRVENFKPHKIIDIDTDIGSD
jgi:hypothetical protein